MQLGNKRMCLKRQELSVVLQTERKQNNFCRQSHKFCNILAIQYWICLSLCLPKEDRVKSDVDVAHFDFKKRHSPFSWALKINTLNVRAELQYILKVTPFYFLCSSHVRMDFDITLCCTIGDIPTNCNLVDVHWPKNAYTHWKPVKVWECESDSNLALQLYTTGHISFKYILCLCTRLHVRIPFLQLFTVPLYNAIRTSAVRNYGLGLYSLKLQIILREYWKKIGRKEKCDKFSEVMNGPTG